MPRIRRCGILKGFAQLIINCCGANAPGRPAGGMGARAQRVRSSQTPPVPGTWPSRAGPADASGPVIAAPVAHSAHHQGHHQRAADGDDQEAGAGNPGGDQDAGDHQQRDAAGDHHPAMAAVAAAGSRPDAARGGGWRNRAGLSPEAPQRLRQVAELLVGRAVPERHQPDDLGRARCIPSSIRPGSAASSARPAQLSFGRRGCWRYRTVSWWRISAVLHAS